jgi:hypothetical protein
LLGSLTVAESAWALTCDQVNGRTIEENDGNPATFNTETYNLTLDPGQSVTYQATSLALGSLLNLLISGVTVLANPDGTYTLSNNTAAPINVNVEVFVHETRLTATGSCGGSTPTTPSTSSADEAAATGGALFQQLTAAAPDTSPAGLPGSTPISDEETPAEIAVRECRAKLEELRKRLVTLENELEGALNSIDLARRFSTEAAVREAESNRNRIVLEIGRVQAEFDKAQKDCENKQRELDYERGDDLPLGPDPIFYSSNRRVAQAHAPWAAMGYGPTTINFSRESGFSVGGMPVKLWARAKGSLLSGSLGRSGVAGSLQLGAVFGVTSRLDLGFYAHILGGTVTSSTLSARLDTFAGGVGAYAKFKAGERLHLGISAGHEWGGNTITIGTATGFFTSSKWSVDASASVPFNVNGVTVTPMVLASFRQLTLGAYTNSASVAVPAITDSTFALSAAVDVARTIPTAGNVIVSVTPKLTARGNFYLKRAATLTPAAGITLQGNAFTLDLNGGLALALANGGSFDVGIGAVGLFGTAQAYNLRLGLRLPIN